MYFGGDFMHDVMSADTIGHELKAINHIMQRKMMLLGTNSGLDKVTVMHGWIIHFIEEHRNCDVYQKDIESAFAISRSTVTNILKLMEKKGYILRESVDSDARLKKLILTEKGIQTGNVLKNAAKENEKQLDSILNEEEKETFVFLLKKFRNGLENT